MYRHRGWISRTALSGVFPRNALPSMPTSCRCGRAGRGDGGVPTDYASPVANGRESEQMSSRPLVVLFSIVLVCAIWAVHPMITLQTISVVSGLSW